MNSEAIWVPHPRGVFVFAAEPALSVVEGVGYHAHALRKGTTPRHTTRGSFTVRPLDHHNAHTLPACDSVVPSPFSASSEGDLIEIL
jgi:hypothetical protein